MSATFEVFDEAGECVERLDATGLYQHDGASLVKVRDATPAEVAKLNAPPPPPPLDSRVDAVESQVADLDAIIVAVLT